jgi:hypothetical protein
VDKQEPDNQAALSDLIHYYEVRLTALTDYSDRVWNRFNWFLTLQLATLGFFFSQFEQIAVQPFMAWGVPIVGAIVAGIWSLMGAEDYVSMRNHRKRTNLVEERVKDQFLRRGVDFTDPVRKRFLRFSQTSLLFLFPLLVAGLWLSVLAWT